ncbi:hypothetical protein WICANDRAFT_68571 [Wickerhamomyces anomalus NRRL Y-366-8]|uniref:Uncharacterized protein n=1 Tax=Wickerhamomyces anomalus (strain ATCC 58044 / CBS 1984 / NCYC 433 / NRRL Y-366-8) TaxID=683960 RepID=A0A1E3P3Z3_WICAA|nr:uncharacterized protein WICANDRAFT_68571 [Wickerhamomyces anomalus NRRL Y-366-8]ODQ60018.1 hypothetical protein WICANDRAFT_68571 [Wickerhamomyces anomalus NRRL Y-366-8]
MTVDECTGFLPLEVLQIVGEYLGYDDPRSYIPLTKVSKLFNYAFRPYIFRDIWIFVAADNYFHDCSLYDVKEVWLDQAPVKYHQRTLVTNLNKFVQLIDVLTENPEFIKMIEHFHVTALCFDPKERTTSLVVTDMMEKAKEQEHDSNLELVFKKSPYKFFTSKDHSEYIKLGIFETSMIQFFTSTERTSNIKSYTNTQKRVVDSRELYEAICGPSNTYFFNTDKGLMADTLFCQIDFHTDGLVSEGYVKALEKTIELMSSHEFKTTSMEVLNFVNCLSATNPNFGHVPRTRQNPPLRNSQVLHLTFNYYFITPKIQ